MCHGPARPAVPVKYKKLNSQQNTVAATSRSLRSARILFGPTHFFLSCGFVFFVVEKTKSIFKTVATKPYFFLIVNHR